MNKISQAQLDELIEHLQGISDSLYQACIDCGFSEDDLTDDQLGEIDNWLFYCPGCGWWCDRGEGHDIDGEDYCEDCYQEYLEQKGE